MHRSLIRNILIVDDEKDFLAVLQAQLENMGFSCVTAESASQAMKVMALTRFDLVLTDINMKDKSGLELMREALQKDPDLTFVIMTGDEGDHSFNEIVSAGAADFITKPFRGEDFGARIRRIERERQILADLSRANQALAREGAINASIAELSSALVFPLSIDDMSRLVLKHAMHLTKSHLGCTGLTGPVHGRSFCAVRPEEPSPWSDFECVETASENAEALVSELIMEKWPFYSNKPEYELDLSRLFPAGVFIRRFMFVPMADSRTFLGFIVLANSREDYTSTDLSILRRLVATYALGIERLRADEELEKTLSRLRKSIEGTVNLLGSALEMRDAQTAGHQRRVSGLACAIAEKMDLPSTVVDTVRMAGLVHDIGKISIPYEILSKSSGLSEVERNFIQSHAAAGYELLKDVEFPWPIAQIVLQHHERADGSGYPQGLPMDGIVLEARILAVADVLEAMVSHRPFQMAVGLDKALEELSNNRGRLYDPEVVDACLSLFLDDGFEFL